MAKKKRGKIHHHCRVEKEAIGRAKGRHEKGVKLGKYMACLKREKHSK